jgi:hypothetical protein
MLGQAAHSEAVAEALSLAAAPDHVAEVEATIAQYRSGLPEGASARFPALDGDVLECRGAGTVVVVRRPAPMPHRPDISVVIPCFRAAATLARAVRSIVAQADPGTEIILVDDASPDDTLATALALATRLPDVVSVLARRDNGGPGAARNDGIRLARGRFLCFLDADDEFAPGFLRAGLDQLHRAPALAAVQTGIDLAGGLDFIDPARYARLVNSLVTNLLVRREVLELLGGFPEAPVFRGARGGEDVAVTRLLVKYFRRGWDARPLLIHHLRPGSHLHRFLADSRVDGDDVVLARRTPEEESGALQLAQLLHEQAFQRRAAVARWR